MRKGGCPGVMSSAGVTPAPLPAIGSAEAKKVLETLASGAEGARLTKEAKASLERLNKRVVGDK
jgi:hypothetical protein